ncbi:MAG: hypothetical protein FGO69_08740 [Methanobacterium sp.]|nr:MAG: hypothetical protein FGO69_08740 [Methanobacterium sp.]
MKSTQEMIDLVLDSMVVEEFVIRLDNDKYILNPEFEKYVNEEKKKVDDFDIAFNRAKWRFRSFKKAAT